MLQREIEKGRGRSEKEREREGEILVKTSIPTTNNPRVSFQSEC